MRRMTTVIDPRKYYPTNHLYTAADYISVPWINTLPQHSVAEIAQFTMTSSTDPRNVKMILDASDRARSKVSNSRTHRNV